MRASRSMPSLLVSDARWRRWNVFFNGLALVSAGAALVLVGAILVGVF